MIKLSIHDLDHTLEYAPAQMKKDKARKVTFAQNKGILKTYGIINFGLKEIDSFYLVKRIQTGNERFRK